MVPALFGNGPVITRIAGRRFGDGREADGVMVAAGEQSAAGRRAERGRVEVVVPQTTRRELVEVRRLDRPAVAAQVPITDVVQHDDQTRWVRPSGAVSGNAGVQSGVDSL